MVVGDDCEGMSIAVRAKSLCGENDREALLFCDCVVPLWLTEGAARISNNMLHVTVMLKKDCPKSNTTGIGMHFRGCCGIKVTKQRLRRQEMLQVAKRGVSSI